MSPYRMSITSAEILERQPMVLQMQVQYATPAISAEVTSVAVVGASVDVHITTQDRGGISPQVLVKGELATNLPSDMQDADAVTIYIDGTPAKVIAFR